MLKQIMNVKGAQNLSKETQQTINGGAVRVCRSPYILQVSGNCRDGYYQQGHCTCCLY